GLALGDRAEIARAEEYADLVEIIRPVDRPVNAEAREAEVALDFGRRAVAEAEHRGRVHDRGCCAVLHLENVDAMRVVEPAMEELQPERQSLGAPQRML